MRILDLIDLNRGETLKQGDSTLLRFQIADRDQMLPDRAGEQARVVFMHNNSIVHEEFTTVLIGNIVEFSISEILPPNVYSLEIHVGGQIFPSDEFVFKITRSALNAEYNIINLYGVDNIVDRAVDEVSAKFVDLTKEKLGLGNVINVKQASEAEVATLGQRLWEEFEQRFINVKWFGAKADGITDDKLAFQSAVDFAHSIGGATIFMPAGTYMIKGNIRWKSNVSLKGAGVGKSIFVVDGMFDGVIVELSQPTHGTGTIFLENCSFEDFEIDGSGYTFTDANIRGKGLFILYMRRARFRNLYLHDTVGTALGCDFLTETVIDSVVVERAGRLFSSTNTGGQSGIGIGTNALEDETVIVSNCHTIDCGNYGIFVESQNKDRIRSRHARIVNCVAKGNRFGIGNKGAGGALIMGCSVYDNTGSGIVLNEQSNGDQIIGNKIENNGGSGILVDGSYTGELSILDNHISKNDGFGVRLRNNHSGYSRKHVQISDNIIYENAYSGIHIEGRLYNFIVSANEIYNNGKSGSANTNLGIGVSGENGQGNIQGNLIYDDQETKTQVAGIKFISSTMANDDMLITNNNFPGYSKSTGLVLGSAPKARLYLANNSGLIYEEFGTATIPDGLTSVTVKHTLGEVPSVVAVPSNAFGQIRVGDLTSFSFAIRRPLAENTGDLVVNWSAKINPI